RGRLAAIARGGERRCHLVPGASPGNVFIHAVGGDGDRASDRGFGPRRPARAASELPARDHRPVERADGAVERPPVRRGRARASRCAPRACESRAVMSGARNYVGLYLAPMPAGSRLRKGAPAALSDKHYFPPSAPIESAALPLARLFSAG